VRSVRGELLAIEDVGVAFGGVAALDGASFAVEAGTACGLIGPNGAGKSTLLNCISGFVRPARGRIAIGGRATSRLRPHDVARLGVARTFQHLGLLERCSVRDNVRLGSLAGARSRRRAFAGADALLERLGLGPVAGERPGVLDQASLRRVELARALAGDPQLVLLDEPLSGLASEEAASLVALLAQLREEGQLTLVVVEHNLGLLTELVDRLVVLDCGRTLAAGESREVLADPAVVEAYLGTAA
jgi:branched-chain amino acid transport system ATP-binding protein